MDISPKPLTPFEQAVSAANGLVSLATQIGVKTSRAGNWYSRTVPEEFCPAIERVTGIKCEALRPDVTWTRDVAGTVTGYHVALLAA